MNFKLYINGRWSEARSGGRWTVVNPATEEPIEEVPFGDAEDAEQAIAAAAAAQPGWAARTAYERALELSPGLFEAVSGLTYLDLAARDTASAINRLDVSFVSRVCGGA